MSGVWSDGLVVVDGRVTDEKLAELLDLQNEQPELDFKRQIVLGTAEGLVELAKDVGAMQVLGGYIVGGVDDHGVPSGEMDDTDTRPFDEANLVPQLLRYLPEPLTVRCRVTEWQDHTLVLIFIGPHPNGYAIFRADGAYERPPGRPRVTFRAGEAFWRDGTRSVRISQAGMERIIARRILAAKDDWISEQQELRRREREELEAGHAGRNLARAPLGAVTLGLATEELTTAVLEIVRADDRIALKHLLGDAPRRAAQILERDQFEIELGELLDKLAALAALFLEYDQSELFARVVGRFAEIYSLPVGPHDDRRFSLTTGISPTEKAPRVFLLVIERIYGLGGLAVRRRRWEAIRELTLQRPERMDEYWKNWLRHALTMGSRAKQLQRQDENGPVIEISLLARAAAVVEHEPALRPDTSDADAILTSLAQFDLLSNLVAVDGAGAIESRSSGIYYTNWARFRQERIQPVAEGLLSDPAMRRAIFGERSDVDLAVALNSIGQMAHGQGVRFDGFWGWHDPPVSEFIEQNLPRQVAPGD